MSGDPLEPLRLRFRERAGADSLALADALARADAPEIERLAHGLAGAAGLFGFVEVGDLAMQIDQGFAAGKTPPDDQVRALIVALRRLV
ncbi:Hpt domain-containing protein [Brevundimonas guildfordensis]|uniref:Hpt domain-containing protein n=1 Tax=Brevundimonas guildfordensis TaxID=2762241 RepID=A0ABR8R1B4_9CAUL|nr:Hpt domain-containing protein [Brevundimonas guildfordensis]MBD7941585.1 Hpt domain-containing protein [Brevundimonas guildfordensis]